MTPLSELKYGSGTRFRFVSGFKVRTKKLKVPRGCRKAVIMDAVLLDIRRLRRAKRSAK